MVRVATVGSSRAARTARGSAAAAIALFVAAFSHGIAGGLPPGLVGLLVSAAFAFPLCVFLAGRCLSVPRLAVAVAASQAAFHVLFGVGAVVPVGAPARHLHGDALRGVPDALPSSLPHAHTSESMWLWHAVAMVITTALIVCGETMVCDVLGALDMPLPRALTAGPAVAPPATQTRVPVMAGVFVGASRLALLDRMRWRGPPALVVP
jgi:GTP-binding protein